MFIIIIWNVKTRVRKILKQTKLQIHEHSLDYFVDTDFIHNTKFFKIVPEIFSQKLSSARWCLANF